MDEIIKYACFRIPGYENMTNAQLVTEITSYIAMTPTTLLGFFTELLANGAIQSELSPLYKNSSWMEDFRTNLDRGDLAAVQALVAIANDLQPMSPVTLSAITLVLNSKAIRLVDVIANELGQTAPEIITETDILNALS